MIGDLRKTALRVLQAWDTTVLPVSRDGRLQEAMEALRADAAGPEHKPGCALLRIPARECDCGAEPVQEPWEHLKPFGYAPGNYMSKCHRCGAVPIMDKRAITCRPCAEALHVEWARKIPDHK